MNKPKPRPAPATERTPYPAPRRKGPSNAVDNRMAQRAPKRTKGWM